MQEISGSEFNYGLNKVVEWYVPKKRIPINNFIMVSPRTGTNFGWQLKSTDDIMLNHKGDMIMRIFKPREDDKNIPKVLVWDGRMI